MTYTIALDNAAYVCRSHNIGCNSSIEWILLLLCVASTSQQFSHIHSTTTTTATTEKCNHFRLLRFCFNVSFFFPILCDNRIVEKFGILKKTRIAHEHCTEYEWNREFQISFINIFFGERERWGEKITINHWTNAREPMAVAPLSLFFSFSL